MVYYVADVADVGVPLPVSVVWYDGASGEDALG